MVARRPRHRLKMKLQIRSATIVEPAKLAHFSARFWTILFYERSTFDLRSYLHCCCSQITFAAICQSDMLWSINLLFRGYRQDHFEHFFDDLPRGLRLRWVLSILARLIVGLFCLFVMFLLIMRADTSRTVLLSFAPVLFIGNLDNAIFGLAKWGYFGDKSK